MTGNHHEPRKRRLQDIDLSAVTRDRSYYPSPANWQDEVLYFLFVDRFSDGREYGGFADLQNGTVTGPGGQRSTPLFRYPEDAGTADFQPWFDSGKTWCGGTLAGLKDKLGYLSRLGVTAIWLSPVFKQVTGSHDYHGYGIQNFLDVDPHYGTREELQELVAAAHQLDIRVILDIILNHAGDVFAYRGNHRYFYDRGQQWPVQGFRQAHGDPGTLPFGEIDTSLHPGAWPDGAVWPAEFQKPDVWTRRGEIRGWDSYPEFVEGDFYALKDLDHGSGALDPALEWDFRRRIQAFQPSQTLHDLAQVYKWWIAYADIDGFRVDTVKHMEPGATRVFANAIHEFAQSIGKENFSIIGEVTGGRARAVTTVDTTGIDAALGIDDIQDKLEFLVKGWRSPGNPQTQVQEGYFDLFRNSELDDKSTHQWYGKHIVVMFDDHDQVGVDHKFRFFGDHSDSYRLLRAALGLNLTSAGIPCIYYGTEQGFNGRDPRTGNDDSDKAYSDVFLRECMFGGPFGSLQSTGRHFFNEQHEVYQFLQALAALRRQHLALRRGRQYLRQVSPTGRDGDFHYPQPIGGELRWVIAWSRIFADREYVCVINTDVSRPLTVWVTVDASLNPPGTGMTCLLSTDASQTRSPTTVMAANGAAIRIVVPPAGFSVYH